MATNFPTSLDSLSDVVTGTAILISTTNNIQDSIEALETKVGVNSSAVTSSHDYMLNVANSWSATLGTTVLSANQAGAGDILNCKDNGTTIFNVKDGGKVEAKGEVNIDSTGTYTDQGAYSLQVNSQIWATSATIATSDAKYKTNITDLEHGLDVVEKLQPRTFDFETDDHLQFPDGTQVGFVAQEAHEALEGTAVQDSIVKHCNGHLGLTYEHIIPILTKAIQEQQSQLNEMRATLDAVTDKTVED